MPTLKEIADEVLNKGKEATENLDLVQIVSGALKIPGVKVSRSEFLVAQFAGKNIELDRVLEEGPVRAGFTQAELQKMAENLILKRTAESSAISFVAGIPGGLAVAGTIPADLLQFFAHALRLSQELSYLYGAQDLWNGCETDDERVTGQMIIYLGAMFGVSGATAGVRLLAAALAKETAERLPKQALTKTFWYPIVKQIGKAIGINVTKTGAASGIAKIIPVLGGAVSGGLTFATMRPMGKRLAAALEESVFDYTDAEIREDFVVVRNIEEILDEEMPYQDADYEPITPVEPANTSVSSEDPFEKIEKLARLRQMGAITEEEYEKKKKQLLDRI